jgi:hypothetical protein
LADIDNEEQKPDAITKGEFQGFMHQLGGTLNQLAAQNAALAQRLEQATAPPPQEPDLPPDFDKSMALEMLRRPRDYTRKTVEATLQQASQLIDQRLQQEQTRAQQVAAANQFWTAFYAANPDLQPFHGEVMTTYNNTPQNEDPSVRANYARDVVRQKLQQVSSAGTDAEQRQRAQRQLAAGAPGSQVASAGAGSAPAGDEYGPSSDITQEYLASRRKQQAQRSGDQLLNDQAYWQEMKQLRLRRQDRQSARGKAA